MKKHLQSLPEMLAILLIIVLFLPKNLAGQCSSLPIPLEERVGMADKICLGQLISKEPFEGKDGNIFTLNRVRVTAWLKGHSTESEIGLLTWGGFLHERGIGQITEPSIQLEDYNEYLLFLEPENLEFDLKSLRQTNPNFRQSFAVDAMTVQFGKYTDPLFPPSKTEAEMFGMVAHFTGEEIQRPNSKIFEPRPFVETPVAETLTSFTPSTSYGGTITPGDFITITGTGFGPGPSVGAMGTAGVYFKNTNDGGLTEVRHIDPQTDYTSWSPTSIVVKVPPNGGTGTIKVISADGMSHVSGSTLTVPYGHSAVYSSFASWGDTMRQRYYFRNQFGPTGAETVGYIFVYNSTLPTAGTAISTDSDAKTAFECALTTWRCETGWNAVTRATNYTTAVLTSDGISSVMYVTTIPGGASIVGRATSRFSGGSSGACSMASTVWWLEEVDIEMENPPNGGAWTFGCGGTGGTNFESVAAHEIGHGHGLQHVMAPTTSLMYYTSAGTVTLSADEIAAGEARNLYSIAATCFNPAGSGIPMIEVPVGVCSAVLLPIELTRFWLDGQQNLVKINWTTASETGNDFFEIERSTDGSRFQKIGKVDGRGNSSAEINYSHDDLNPPGGLLFYRLRQTDFDGKTAVSDIQSIRFREKSGLALSPNPASGELFISGKTETDVQVFNSFGQLVRAHFHENGASKIDIGGLASGLYFLVDLTTGERLEFFVE